MSDYSRFEIKLIFALLKSKRSFSCFFFDGKYFDSVQKRINSLRFLFEGSFYVRRINEKNLFLAEHFFFTFLVEVIVMMESMMQLYRCSKLGWLAFLAV